MGTATFPLLRVLNLALHCAENRRDRMWPNSPSLGRPANTLLRHNLTSNLENSIRGSSSNDDHPDVLHRLDARMLDFEHGEIGWDVFTLEYKIDPPVDVVLDENSMHIYTKLFTHLWKIKRCEHTLNDAWRKVTNGSRWWKKVEGKCANLLLGCR